MMAGGIAGPGSVRLSHPDAAALPSLEAVPFVGPELSEILGQLGITEIRLHHLADFGREAAHQFIWLIDALDLPFEFTMHDYLAVCPRINLADRSGMYCGEPPETGCRRCLARRRSAYGAPDIRRWRREWGPRRPHRGRSHSGAIPHTAPAIRHRQRKTRRVAADLDGRRRGPAGCSSKRIC